MNQDNSHQDESSVPTEPPPAPKPRGFAALPPERRQEIASKGGVAARARGTAYRFSTEQAKEAGRKGGLAKHRSRGRARG